MDPAWSVSSSYREGEQTTAATTGPVGDQANNDGAEFTKMSWGPNQHEPEKTIMTSIDILRLFFCLRAILNTQDSFTGFHGYMAHGFTKQTWNI